MADIDLLRIGGLNMLQTQGILRMDGEAFAVTLEDPWDNNIPEISCIPAATYICRRVQSPHFGETFEICDVPNRTHILFHKGNNATDTRGCVLVAEKFVGHSIAESANGYNEFMSKLVGRDSFTLSVIDVNKYLPI